MVQCGSLADCAQGPIEDGIGGRAVAHYKTLIWKQFEILESSL